MLVAIVVKYADNVLKGFATSLSIIISSVISAIYFADVDINGAFILGAIVVLLSVYYYGYNPPASSAESNK
jgi:UDP-sugar transporter A1/2/3